MNSRANTSIAFFRALFVLGVMVPAGGDNETLAALRLFVDDATVDLEDRLTDTRRPERSHKSGTTSSPVAEGVIVAGLVFDVSTRVDCNSSQECKQRLVHHHVGSARST